MWSVKKPFHLIGMGNLYSSLLEVKSLCGFTLRYGTLLPKKKKMLLQNIRDVGCDMERSEGSCAPHTIGSLAFIVFFTGITTSLFSSFSS